MTETLVHVSVGFSREVAAVLVLRESPGPQRWLMITKLSLLCWRIGRKSTLKRECIEFLSIEVQELSLTLEISYKISSSCVRKMKSTFLIFTKICLLAAWSDFYTKYVQRETSALRCGNTQIWAACNAANRHTHNPLRFSFLKCVRDFC